MNEEKKKSIELILGMQKTLINNIYEACDQNAKIFEVDFVPVKFVGHIGDIATNSIASSLKGDVNLIKSEKNKEVVEIVLKLVVRAVETIKITCFENAEAYHVDYVPVKFLKTVCDKVFATLEKGLKDGFGN